MLLIVIALSGLGLLGWASWKLYELNQFDQQGKSFCGRSCQTCSSDANCTSEEVREPNQEIIEHKISFFKNQTDIDVSDIEQKLQKLSAGFPEAEVHLAVFGDISSGKSSLINALIPDADVKTSVIGGTTRKVSSYCWENHSMNKKIVFIDLPGLNEVGGELEPISLQAVNWSHIPVFICESDLSDSQYQYLKNLMNLNKPLLVAVNKTDHYSQEELKQIITRIRERLSIFKLSYTVVGISCGGQEERIIKRSDGKQELQIQKKEPKLDELFQSLQQILGSYTLEQLNVLREQEIYQQLFNELKQVEFIHRKQQAKKIAHQTALKILQLLLTKSPGMELSAAQEKDKLQSYHHFNQNILDLYQVYDNKNDIADFYPIIEKEEQENLIKMMDFSNKILKHNLKYNQIEGNLLVAMSYSLIFLAHSHALGVLLESRLWKDNASMKLKSAYSEKFNQYLQNIPEQDIVDILNTKSCKDI